MGSSCLRILQEEMIVRTEAISRSFLRFHAISKTTTLVVVAFLSKAGTWIVRILGNGGKKLKTALFMFVMNTILIVSYIFIFIGNFFSRIFQKKNRTSRSQNSG